MEKKEENKTIKLVAGVALILLPVIVAAVTANNTALGAISTAAGWSILWTAALVFLSPVIGLYLIYSAIAKRIILK